MTRKPREEAIPKPLWTRWQYIKSEMVLGGMHPLEAERLREIVQKEFPSLKLDEKKTWNEWHVLDKLKEKARG